MRKREREAIDSVNVRVFVRQALPNRAIDLTLREIGVQDLGVGRRIKIMAEGLQGRALAYRAALAGGSTPLAEVLRRNAYGGRPPVDEAVVARLETYVRRQAARLADTLRNNLTSTENGPSL